MIAQVYRLLPVLSVYLSDMNFQHLIVLERLLISQMCMLWLKRHHYKVCAPSLG